MITVAGWLCLIASLQHSAMAREPVRTDSPREAVARYAERRRYALVAIAYAVVAGGLFAPGLIGTLT